MVAPFTSVVDVTFIEKSYAAVAVDAMSVNIFTWACHCSVVAVGSDTV